MNKDDLSKIGVFLAEPQRSQDLINYMKILVLQYVPKNENEVIKIMLDKKDVDTFMGMLEKYVPKLQDKILEYIRRYQ